MATPEGKVKDMIKKHLKKMGCYFFIPVSNGAGVHGIPDIVGCYGGMFFGIEVKKPGRRGEKNRGVSALQLLQKRKIQQDGGGIWVVIDCEEEMLEFMSNLIEVG